MSPKRTSLADLLGQVDAPDTATESAGRVPVGELAPNPDNPRGAIDASSPDFVELCTSIESLGVVQALTVCTAEAFLAHHPEHTDVVGDAAYVVVAGHRRLEAARLAGVEDIPVSVDDRAAENPLVWAVAENLQRVGLSPLQEAQTLRVLTDRAPAGQGMSQAAAAKAIGKTQPFVSGRLALLKLAPEVQELIERGEVRVKRGGLLAKLPLSDQVAAEQALRRLVPELQAEIDGGKLTDPQLAMRLAALPAREQVAARRSPVGAEAGAEGDNSVMAERSKPSTRIPAQADDGEGRGSPDARAGSGPEADLPSGDNSVMTAGDESSDGAGSDRTIRLRDPQQIADDLATHLSSRDFKALLEILIKRM
ncbi:hypothetical protein BIV57_12745 [Mangrovactinospora gilvigrisea]|uniref:ParB-like N-terminal domain-containing protein n=1 Tax=Mangrovactinospora gilvigrisea TaxID=1428644 RepID=A0A1J7BEP0_9ACTN|nr:ParB/RepB/Spo0J family partition protein [Mangrovactinospora gilvigrisea]OIV37102.1 hypothetical protein BIV57_12745 [Mangrovactinospora gilvigrisea]